MITGRSKDAAPNISRPTSVTGVNRTPSLDRATTTLTPRPSSSGRRTR